MQKLKGKTALVTGGNSGMGFATAQVFLAEGATVIITGRNRELIEEATKSLGAGAFGIVSDAGKMADLNALQKQVLEISPNIDILYANAGVFFLAPFEQMTEEMFDSNMDINFKGAFFTVQKLLPLINEGGSIILNATIAAHKGLGGSAAYSASKAAVLSLSKTLAVELAGKKIRVNCISPGGINTPIMGKTGMDMATIQQFASNMILKIPQQRFGEPDEIAKAALFLATDDSSFMTGSELTVDGGQAIVF